MGDIDIDDMAAAMRDRQIARCTPCEPFSGRPLEHHPSWEELPDATKDGWRESARKLVATYNSRRA